MPRARAAHVKTASVTALSAHFSQSMFPATDQDQEVKAPHLMEFSYSYGVLVLLKCSFFMAATHPCTGPTAAPHTQPALSGCFYLVWSCAGHFKHSSPEMPSDTSVNEKVRGDLPAQLR